MAKIQFVAGKYYFNKEDCITDVEQVPILMITFLIIFKSFRQIRYL